MEAKFSLLLFVLFGLVQMSLAAAKWPKCKNDTDLLDYYTSIFERHTESSAVKRGTTWTFSCLHAAIIKDENEDSLFSYQIYECCAKCEFPTFSLCALADNPNWQCGSEAYDCVFTCRDEDSVLEAVVSASSLGMSRKRELNITDTEVSKVRKRLRLLRHEKKCFERQCTVTNGVRDCCLKSTCVSLKSLQTKLGKARKSHEKRLRKLAKGKSSTK